MRNEGIEDSNGFGPVLGGAETSQLQALGGSRRHGGAAREVHGSVVLCCGRGLKREKFEDGNGVAR